MALRRRQTLDLPESTGSGASGLHGWWPAAVAVSSGHPDPTTRFPDQAALRHRPPSHTPRLLNEHQSAA